MRYFVVVNGSWGPWQGWSDCSQTCGSGSQTRRRMCNDPPPNGGGNECQGNYAESVSCNAENCPGKRGQLQLLAQSDPSLNGQRP